MFEGESRACGVNRVAGGRSGCRTAIGSSSALCSPPRPWIWPCLCTSALFNDAQVSHFLSIPDEVDLYSVTLQRGETLDASIDAQQAGSGLTSLLRVFDANGTPLALDNQQGGDPQLTLPGGDRRHLLHRRQQRPQQQLQSDGRGQRRPR